VVMPVERITKRYSSRFVTGANDAE